MKSAIKFIALIFFQCITITFLFAQIPASAPAQEKSLAQFPSGSAYSSTILTYKIIVAPNNTFGYEVFADSRLIIHQTRRPALLGNEGFKIKEIAEKVVLLLIDKIKKGEIQPTVSIEEIQNLNAIKK